MRCHCRVWWSTIPVPDALPDTDACPAVAERKSLLPDWFIAAFELGDRERWRIPFDSTNSVRNIPGVTRVRSQEEFVGG
jgi:hypothetical protein